MCVCVRVCCWRASLLRSHLRTYCFLISVSPSVPPSVCPSPPPWLPRILRATCSGPHWTTLGQHGQVREERDAQFDHIEVLCALESPLRSPQGRGQACVERGGAGGHDAGVEEGMEAADGGEGQALGGTRPLSRPVSALAQEPYALVGAVQVTLVQAQHLPQMEYVFVFHICVRACMCIRCICVHVYICTRMHLCMRMHLASLYSIDPRCIQVCMRLRLPVHPVFVFTHTQ